MAPFKRRRVSTLLREVLDDQPAPVPVRLRRATPLRRAVVPQIEHGELSQSRAVDASGKKFARRARVVQDVGEEFAARSS